MSNTDVTEVTQAIGSLQIEGPGATSNEATHVHNPRPTFLEKTEQPNTDEPTEPLPAAARASELLFNADDYLGVPTVDGQATDGLEIAFAGKIKYEPTDENARKMFDDLTLGKEVELRVSGVVAKKSGAWNLVSPETEKERKVVTGAVGVKVTDLWILSPEQL